MAQLTLGYVLVITKVYAENASTGKKGFTYKYQRFYPQFNEGEVEANKRKFPVSNMNSIEYEFINYSNHNVFIDEHIQLDFFTTLQSLNRHKFVLNENEIDQTFHTIRFGKLNTTPEPPECCLTEADVFEALQSIYNGTDLDGNPLPTNLYNAFFDFEGFSVFKNPDVDVSWLQIIFSQLQGVQLTPSVFQDSGALSVFIDSALKSVFKNYSNSKSVFTSDAGESVFTESLLYNSIFKTFSTQESYFRLEMERIRNNNVSIIDFIDSSPAGLNSQFNSWKVSTPDQFIISFNYYTMGVNFYLSVSFSFL